MAGQRVQSSTGNTTSEKPKQMSLSHEGEHHGESDATRAVPITTSVKIFTFCASMNSVIAGYDAGSSTHIGPLVQGDFGLSDEQREVVIGAVHFFSMFGALASQYFSDRYGRRTTFAVTSLFNLSGLMGMALAQNFKHLLFARALLGLGMGVGFAIDPLYISEISPAKHRGELVTWADIGVNVGILIGFSNGLMFSEMRESDQWRAMCMLGMVFPILMVYLALQVLPETPRWCVLHGKDGDARKVLHEIYPKTFNVDMVIDDIKESLERERMADERIGWSVIFRPSPAIRRMLLIGLLIPVAQQACGIEAIQYYLIDVMDEVGIPSGKIQSYILMGLGVIQLACIFIASRLLDSQGRRFTFFLSLSGVTFALLLLALSFTTTALSTNREAIALTGLFTYMLFFSLGLGPAGWLIPSEVFPTCIRAKGVSVATFLNRGTATLMVVSFLTVKEAITWPRVFFILAGFSLFTLLMIFWFLPETKNRSLEDMSLYFAEVTGDFSIIDAERKLRVEAEIQKMNDGNTLVSAAAEDETQRDMTETGTTADNESPVV